MFLAHASDYFFSFLVDLFIGFKAAELKWEHTEGFYKEMYECTAQKSPF